LAKTRGRKKLMPEGMGLSWSERQERGDRQRKKSRPPRRKETAKLIESSRASMGSAEKKGKTYKSHTSHVPGREKRAICKKKGKLVETHGKPHERPRK